MEDDDSIDDMTASVRSRRQQRRRVAAAVAAVNSNASNTAGGAGRNTRRRGEDRYTASPTNNSSSRASLMMSSSSSQQRRGTAAPPPPSTTTSSSVAATTTTSSNNPITPRSTSSYGQQQQQQYGGQQYGGGGAPNGLVGGGGGDSSRTNNDKRQQQQQHSEMHQQQQQESDDHMAYHLQNDDGDNDHDHVEMSRRESLTSTTNINHHQPQQQHIGSSSSNNGKNKKWFFQRRLPLVMSASHDDSSHDDYDDGRYPRGIALSNTSTLHSGTHVDGDDFDKTFSDAEDDYLRTKQSTAVLSITLTCVQLLILCLQLAMCGIATLDINPFVGPFPDAFSEWGGKNPYRMVVLNEWWRLVTPSFLHVGILHLLANAFCQLEPIALFEREWGSTRWAVLYLLSSVACQAVSSVDDPNTIAVGSSGALMGLFAAKLAQVMTHMLFTVRKQNQDDNMIRLDQLSSVICGLILVSLLSFFTYIDWSGHMGGLFAGFFGGMVLFCNPIASCCCKLLWMVLGLAGLVAGFGFVFYTLLRDMMDEFDDELSDSCEYFRSLFPEGYECGCLWQ